MKSINNSDPQYFLGTSLYKGIYLKSGAEVAKCEGGLLKSFQYFGKKIRISKKTSSIRVCCHYRKSRVY